MARPKVDSRLKNIEQSISRIEAMLNKRDSSQSIPEQPKSEVIEESKPVDEPEESAGDDFDGD